MANIWTEFKSLIDTDINVTGVVASTDATNNTSIITLLSGDSIKVFGTATVGHTVVVQNSEIMQSSSTALTETQWTYTLNNEDDHRTVSL